jgi:hypothetical protein
MSLQKRTTGLVARFNSTLAPVLCVYVCMLVCMYVCVCMYVQGDVKSSQK